MKTICSLSTFAAGLACAAAAFMPVSAARATGLPVAAAPAAGASRFERDREDNLINNVDVKAAITWSKGQEELFLSPRCSGKVDNFAYIVPVPTRPQVSVLRGELFHDLASIAFPDDTSASGVNVLERKVVGAYEMSVLSADDSASLGAWLKKNKYVLPKSAQAPMQAYIDKGWLFAACRIKDPASAKGIKTGTLAPIRLRFAAPRPILPVRFCSASPTPVQLVAYLMIPEAEVKAAGSLRSLKIEQGPTNRAKKMTLAKTTAFASQSKYETLARLQNGVSWRVYVEKQTLHPEDCTADYVWSLGGGTGDE